VAISRPKLPRNGPETAKNCANGAAGRLAPEKKEISAAEFLHLGPSLGSKGC